MNELLKKDITVKIISVLSAVLLWFIALDTQNPYGEKTLTVPLEVINMQTLEQKNLKWTDANKNPTVDITVRGRQKVIAPLSDKDFDIELDFSNINTIQDTSLKISEPKHQYGKDISVSLKSKYYTIQMERIKSAEFDVQVEIKGKEELEKKGYRVIEVKPTSKVTLQDVESKINSIASVRASVDVSSTLQDVTQLRECKVLDKDNKEVFEAGKNLNVNVFIRVGKEVPLKLVVQGTPKKDYVEALREIVPQTVLIQGEPELLQKIQEVETMPVDISNLDDSIDVPVTLKLPEGVKLADPSAQVMAKVQIEHLEQKEFTISKYDISLTGADTAGEQEYEVQSANISLVVKGRQKDLEQLNVNELKPSVHVAGLGEGSHNLVLEVVLPQGVTLVSSSEVEVRVDSVLTMRIEREFINPVNVQEGFSYTISEESVWIAVKGRKAELDRINSAAIKPTVDVAGLTKGTHTVLVNLTLPASMKLIHDPVVEIVVETIEEQAIE